VFTGFRHNIHTLSGFQPVLIFSRLAPLVNHTFGATQDGPEGEVDANSLRGAELVAKVRRRMTLAALRKERKISQATVAEALGIGQMQISRLEKRKDPRLSTMARTVAAMGGHLTMIATFPDQEPVVLIPSQLAERATRGTKRA